MILMEAFYLCNNLVFHVRNWPQARNKPTFDHLQHLGACLFVKNANNVHSLSQFDMYNAIWQG